MHWTLKLLCRDPILPFHLGSSPVGVLCSTLIQDTYSISNTQFHCYSISRPESKFMFDQPITLALFRSGLQIFSLCLQLCCVRNRGFVLFTIVVFFNTHFIFTQFLQSVAALLVSLLPHLGSRDAKVTTLYFLFCISLSNISTFFNIHFL